MGHDPNSHQLLAIVPTVHHERISQSFNDWALGLAETLDGIAAGRVRNVDGRPDLNVVARVFFWGGVFFIKKKPLPHKF